jgi:hypothetical protein
MSIEAARNSRPTSTHISCGNFACVAKLLVYVVNRAIAVIINAVADFGALADAAFSQFVGIAIAIIVLAVTNLDSGGDKAITKCLSSVLWTNRGPSLTLTYLRILPGHSTSFTIGTGDTWSPADEGWLQEVFILTGEDQGGQDEVLDSGAHRLTLSRVIGNVNTTK